MNISEVLSKQTIALNMKVQTKVEALSALTDLLCESGAVKDREAFLNDVIKREEISTTGIGNYIAIPHGKSANVEHTAAAVGRVDGELEWQSMDGKPVKFIVLLAVNENDKTGVHVKLLSQMARKLASEAICEKLINAETADEILEIFSN